MEPVQVDLVRPQGWMSVTYAENQPEYIPLPVLRCVDGRVISQWRLTDQEREKIAAGSDVFLTVHTFNYSLQPVMLTVGGAPIEPIPNDEPVAPPRPAWHNPVG